MKRLTIIISAAIAALCTVQAELAPGTTIEDYLPTITATTIEWQGDVYQWQGGLDEYEVEDTKFKLKGEFVQDTGFGLITLQELEFDPDPSVFLTQIVENNTASAQTYTLNINQPAFLASPSSTTYGSVTLSLLDVAGDGASLTDNGIPIYKSFIDGNPAGTLLPTPTSLSTPPGTVDSTSDFFLGSYPGGVASSIAIQIEFILSPGDRATVQSRFDVIPEPASAILLVATSSAFVFIRRRFIA